MGYYKYGFLIFLAILAACPDNDSSDNEANKNPATKPEEKITPNTPPVQTPVNPKSVKYNYIIKDVDFLFNHAVRVANKDEIIKVNNFVDKIISNGELNSSDPKYAKAEDLLQKTSADLESIFKQNNNIKKAFINYKENDYIPLNEMLREGRYTPPSSGPAAACSVDPLSSPIFDITLQSTIRCMDLAFEKKKSLEEKAGTKTLIFRALNSDQGDNFDGLKYGCFNKGQQDFLIDAGFGSTSTSLNIVLKHHNSASRDWNKNKYGEKMYEFNQKAIIFMIEVEEKDPIFRFPKSLDIGTLVTTEEKEVLLKRGYKLKFICEPTEFLPELPNEFEYIPNFNINAAKPTDYKVYRVIRARLEYP